MYVIGDVIGVGFRAWTKIQAKIIGVTGWVKNVFDRSDLFGPNGGVEIVIQGEESLLNQMVSLIKSGPPISRVNEVKIFEEKPKKTFDGFEIRK